jgi:hypothetical protein
MLVFRQPQSDFAQIDQPDTAAVYWGAWSAYVGALMESGLVVSGNGLQRPETAVQVRLRDGQRQVQDGPYADTREHLGGYFILELPAIDAALEWAARAPCAATGSVEVRPVLLPGQSMM